MGTNPNKPAICYGMFVMRAMSLYLKDSEYLAESKFRRMKVTSFSTLPSGTVMAHGQDLDGNRGSVHRRVDDMFFYRTREAMEEAQAELLKVEYPLVRKVYAAYQLVADCERELRVKGEAALGRRAIQPRELD